MTTKRILVCGGRHFTDYAFLRDTLLRELVPWLPDVLIIQGGAAGADQLAAKFAWHHCTPRSKFFSISDAEWDQFGHNAGPARNERMLQLSQPELVLAMPGGGGTADMCRRAAAAGIKVRRFELPVEIEKLPKPKRAA